jgi:hypothetical protein
LNHKVKVVFWVSLICLCACTSPACVWDADTLVREKLRSHDLAKTILGDVPPLENSAGLQARIQTLETNRDESNPDWWNNLAGAYIRLGQSAAAVKLLAPIASKFPDNYGIHANLGTAYHLLGRYAEAEKEIARDLEINPDAHFGLEKYHLALLQYLMRDDNYKSRHTYVDEWSQAFSTEAAFRWLRPKGKLDAFNTNALDWDQINELAKDLVGESENEQTNSWEWKAIQDLKSRGYVPPPYRFQWNLAADTNFEAGVIYMAQMNPKEPACFEMLGIAAGRCRDFNLEADAYQRAIQLGSLKTENLKQKVDELHNYIRESLKYKLIIGGILGLLSIALLSILYSIYRKISGRWLKSKAMT